MSPDSVIDRATFCTFLESLAADFRSNPSSWENGDLATFLEALSAYTRDLPGYYARLLPERDPDQATWRLFADIARGARIYE